MVSVTDESEAAEDRSLTPPPSPSPPSPPPIVPSASPLQALTTLPPFIPMPVDGLTLAENPRRTPPASPSPSPSAYPSPSPTPSPSPSKDDPLEQGVGGTAWCQGEAGRRLPAAATSAATNSTCAAKTSTHLQPAAAAIGGVDPLTTPPPVVPMPVDGLTLAENPRRTPPASPCPSPSPSAPEQGGAGTTLRQAEAELRLPLKKPKPKPKRSIRQAAATSAPADSTWAAKSVPLYILQEIKPGADTGSEVAVDDGDDGLYLMDGQQAKSRAGFRAGNVSWASDAETGAGRQLTLSIFTQWAAKRAPDLLPYLEPADAGTLLALEDQEADLALLDWQEASMEDKHKLREQQDAVNMDSRDDKTSASRDDQEAIHPRDETTCDIAVEDQEKVGSVVNVDVVDRPSDIYVEVTDSLKEQVVVDYWSVFSDTAALEGQKNEAVCKGHKQIGANYAQLKANTDCSNCPSEQRNPSAAETLKVNRSGLPILEETIKITITEKVDAECIGKINTADICGKIVVQFPPDLDRHVQFMVGILDGIDFRAYSRVDRELFNRIQLLRSERFPQMFELLKWNKEKSHIPSPLEVSSCINENQWTKHREKGDSLYNIEIICRPTGMSNIQNVVVTIPMPRVDQTAIARRTSSYVWKSVGSHRELEDSVEWSIPHIGAWDERAIICVDARCYDGCQEISQFYPIRVEFSYDQSIGSKVGPVLRSGDGRVVDVQQDTVGRWSYTFHHPKEIARRAAEAEDEALAWELAPWDPWDDEEMDADW